MAATKKAAVTSAATTKKVGAATKAKSAKVKSSREKKSKDLTLVVVESPAKAKTIEKYLGKKFMVRASMGHLRDLPKSQFGIDVEHDFEPKYINIRGKGDIIKALKNDAKKANHIYLASDPDREGEAIAWHLSFILGIDPGEKCRIVFNEITKPAIQAAVGKPRPIDMDRVDAQQARRLLDRIVGYNLSPLLWRKVKKGLSAGRVQSVTLRLICDREKEVLAFKSEEYWSIGLKLKKDSSPQFQAELTQIDGEKLAIHDGKTAKKITADLEKQKFVVQEVKRGIRKRKPAAPFTTSSLQQDASRRLGFISRKTMMIAQQLYEGLDLGKKGRVGLITYMRTDSVRISDLAQNDARDFIRENYGEKYIPAKPNVYASKTNAQDAHEGIRPTDIKLTPETVEEYLSKDQFKLYRLIWQRFAASQMTPAQYDTMSVSIAAGEKYLCRSNGSKLKFAGFTAVYAVADDNKKEKDVVLPELEENEELKCVKVESEQHFTEPPPRYNDASLVKTLEEKGIGRPSTYAPTIETILARGYIQRIEKTFRPTELGTLVLDMLEEHFKDIVDVEFTAKMENELDEIAEGKLPKNKLLGEFYGPFSKTLAEADEAIGEVEIPVEVSDVPCEKCGRMMVIKLGRYGKFLACPGFPECRNAKPILKDMGVKCPKCGGSIVERRSRRGRNFYGCANYPDCDYTTWDSPLPESKCPTCGSFMLSHRARNEEIIYCSNDACATRADHPINKIIERRKPKTQGADKEKTVAATKAESKKAAPKKSQRARKNTKQE